jgi:hypothetical protein
MTNCGPGSTEEMTRKLREFLPKVIKKHKIKTVNDAGCGDLFWVSLTDIDVDYVGYDDNIREVARGRALERDWKLVKADITKTPMRRCDLVICKDVFRHHSPSGIKNILSMMDAKYLLADFDEENRPGDTHHRDIGDETYCLQGNKTDLREYLGEPEEQIQADEQGKRFGLWKL